MERETRELIIVDDFGKLIGDLSLISFVKEAANETEYMFFSKHDEAEFQLSKFEEEKKIVTGCALRSNFKMLQKDPVTGVLYDAIISPKQIRLASEVYLKDSNHLHTNLQHGKLLTKEEIEGVYGVESWIVEDPKNDKACALGFSNIEAGDWYVSYKVENDDFRNFLKGFGGGFSIEGLFRQRIASSFSKFHLSRTNEIDLIKYIAFDHTKSDNQKEKEIRSILGKI